MERVLVCLVASTRGHRIAFPSFKRRVLDELNADLAVALLIDEHYQFANPYWQLAKYRWTAPVLSDYGEAYDRVQRLLCDERGVAPLEWRRLLEIGGIWLGGIRGTADRRVSASSILPFCRWLLLQGLLRDGVLERYDRYVMTRSDFIWTCPHPPLSVLDRSAIWMPAGEDYGGLNDRHMVVAREDLADCLDMIEDVVLDPVRLYDEMKDRSDWNDEQFLAHHLRRKGRLPQVRRFPCVMYTARAVDDESPTWDRGLYDGTAGHYIKYPKEFRSATAYASVIGGRADWERGAWAQFDAASFTPPPVAPARRLLHGLSRRYHRVRSWLRRPGRLDRIGRRLRQTLGGPSR